MEEIKKLIVGGNINIEFYNRLKSFTSSKENVTHLPRILSYLYSQSSFQSKLKAKDEAFISTLVECVVLLIKCSLSSKDVQSNQQLRASCLRNASNFSVVLHQEGYENTSILDSTVACVVSMIDSNINWTTEELNQSLANLRTLLSLKLSTQDSKLSVADRHSVWNRLVILYKPIEDKTKLISFLREVAFGKSQPIGDVFYLQTCAHVFTINHLAALFGILDTYYAFAWKSQDTSGIFNVASHILDGISAEINSDKELQGIGAKKNKTQLEMGCISVYKHLHEITHHITKSWSESVMSGYFTRFTNQLNILLTLVQSVTSQKDSNQNSSLCQKTLTSILMHLSLFQLKHLNVFVQTETIHCILNMYKTIFHMAQFLWTEEQYLCQKHDNLLFYHSWYACLTIIIESLTVTTLHKKLTEVLKLINNFIGNMFVLLYSKNAVDTDDRCDLSSFLSNLGKLSQLVLKLDAGHVNKNMNMILGQWLLEVFPNIPDKYSTTVVDTVVNIAYNCVKTCLPASDTMSLLTILEPIVTLCIMNESCVPSAVRLWVRVQYQHKQKHPDYQIIHLCDHLDNILTQVRAKYPTVSFVNTSGLGFVSRVLKSELDEVVTYRQMEKDSTSTSYESSIMRRVLHLTQTLSSQDLIVSDICLSTLLLTFKHEPAFTETNTKLKAYVSELKRKLMTNGDTRSTSSTHGHTRSSKALDPNNSELVTSEQALVTEHTCVCLLLANYYVIEHFEKVAKKRATVKRSKPVPDGKDQKQKGAINDLDKGIEMATNETNVFPTSMDVRETEDLVRILDKVALMLSKVVQSDVALDLTKVSSITKIDQMVSHILYVGYSYRIYLERDKEIEFWKLSLQLSVLLEQDALFVECVSNLLWLDEGLRPNHILRTDELVSAPLKPPLPSYVKTLYQFARIKQALSLNQTSEASTDLSQVKLDYSPIPSINEILVQYYYWYLKCQILMKKPDPTTMDHAYIVACCKEGFKCLFKNYDTVSLMSPVVIHVISCYLNITLLVTRFHTVHLNPTEGRQVLSAVLTFTQDLCLPLWTAQLLSLSAGLDVITCNKDDLLFKTSCLEQVLLHKSNSEHDQTAPLTPRIDASSNRTKHHFTPSQKVGQDVTRDAVVTMTTVTGSSLASPRFASTVSNKLPSFIAHRSCQCFECRNFVYQELLVSLGLLQGLYYQLDQDYDMTRFCFQNAEHLLNKLKILKGLPEDITTEWQSRLLFYRANLEGILCHPTKLLELNQELQAMDNGEDYFEKHFEFLWEQEQYLMFVSASLESQTKASKVHTPTTNRRLLPSVKPASMLPAHLLKTPKVQNINVKTVSGVNTVYPAVKFKENSTPKAKVRLTLAFDEDEEEEKEWFI
uniref:Uncharacterized protein n=1 Tax=Cacopsylla melanoneura TaxID=428564 RepID=A0A8D9BYX6_9HEMI